jgi:cytochrome b6-f complex subunit 4
MSDKPDRKKLIPFFPDYVLDEMIAWYIALALLIVVASLFPAGLEEQADPLSTPAHIKPEWYFLFLYQALKWVPRIVGVLRCWWRCPLLTVNQIAQYATAV